MVESENRPGKPLNTAERNRVLQARDILTNEFTWETTPQGEEYWIAVVDNLNAIATDRSDLCETCGQEVKQ